MNERDENNLPPDGEFDRESYIGQACCYVSVDYVDTPNDREVIWIARRYTDPLSEDDSTWGNWIKVTANDCDDVAIQLLHFTSYLGYEVVADEDNTPPESEKEEARRQKAQGLYLRYKEEERMADEAKLNMDNSARPLLKELFAGLADIHRMQAEMWRHQGTSL